MLLMIIGLLVFFAIHLAPAAPELRRGVVERFGESAYKIAFSLISALGLIMIVYGYAKLGAAPGKNPQIWTPPLWTRHVAMLLMGFSIVTLVAAYVPSRIRTALRHPMLLAIKLWALAHLLVRGDLASMILFGSFLAYAVFDRISVKRREALGPLGSRTGGALGDLTVIAVGVALYAGILLWGHARLIGIALVPGWT